MTDDMMNLRCLVDKNADAGLLRDIIGFAAEKLMALEMGAATQRNVLAFVRIGDRDTGQHVEGQNTAMKAMQSLLTLVTCLAELTPCGL